MDAKGAPSNTSSFRPREMEGRVPGGDRDGTGPKAHRSILRRVGGPGWLEVEAEGRGGNERKAAHSQYSWVGIMLSWEVNWGQIIQGV